MSTSKPVNSSHISVFKSQFDILYAQNINNLNVVELGEVVEKMTGLEEKIVNALNRASVNVARHFKGTATTTSTNTVDADVIKRELQDKINQMLLHYTEAADGTKSLANKQNVTLIKPFGEESASYSVPLKPSSSKPSKMQPPKTPSPFLPVPQPAKTPDPATQFAVGFGNLAANCWANSLLSMILSMPSFRQAFEAVGNYYVRNLQNSQDSVHGQAMLDALQAYDIALASKNPVPALVSQNVRLAFHHFFGYKNPQSFHEIFSDRPYQQEDASEGMQVLIGRYEQILQEQAPNSPLPQPYCPLQTERQYRPVGNSFPADPEKLGRNDYSKLSNDNVSSLVNHDYQILLDLQNKGHLSFSALLNEYFCSTHPQDHDVSTYLLPDNNIQQFELIGERRQFTQIPQELLLTIKRFGANLNGTGFKIASPLAVHKTLVLPAIATTENAPIAYELDTFNVHKGDFGGGHYIAYRKIQGQWIEADDGSVRIVTELEIDQILRGEKGPTYTSCLHHYTLIDAAQQQQHVVAAAQAAHENAEILAQKINTCKLNIQSLETLLRTNHDAFRETFPVLTSEVLKTLKYTVWVNDKTPDALEHGTHVLNTNPERLRDVKLPWLIASTGKNIMEQLLMAQRLQLEIADEKLSVALLHSFLDKIKSTTVSNEELLIALNALPDALKNSLHSLVYQSHLKKFGHQHVNEEKYHHAYGKVALEGGDIRKTICEATESVLNLGGKNILEQLIFEHRTKAEKLQSAFEKEQLQAFYDLLMRPANEITSYQLFKAFEQMDLREEIKEKLYWHLWFGHRTPSTLNYGTTTFKNDPRSLLSVRDPNIARAPVCPTGSNLLFQLIKLLEKESK